MLGGDQQQLAVANEFADRDAQAFVGARQVNAYSACMPMKGET